MEKKSYFVTFVYSKNFHGREPSYFVDHGEGVGYDLQLEGIQYTSSLEETEHDIVEYAKNYTNKVNPLFGFHTFERPGSAFLICTTERTTEQLSERWYDSHGTLWEKSETSTFSGDPEEKRIFKGWKNPHFKPGDIVEYYTPKKHYVGIGVVKTVAIPPEIAETEINEQGKKYGYERDFVLIMTPNINEDGFVEIGTSFKYSVVRVHPVNVFKPSLPLDKRDERILRFVEETEKRRCVMMRQIAEDEKEEEKRKKEVEEKRKKEAEERKRKAFMNAASNFCCDGFE
jgi:hypothetical protein